MTRNLNISSLTPLAFLALLSILVFSTGCTGVDTGSGVDNGSITIATSVLPQETFVKAVGGDHVTVNALIPPGASPATYDPKPSDLQMVERADIYFRIGHIPFEKAHMQTLERNNDDMVVVDTSENVSLITSREMVDPHIWLSPRQVIRQVDAIRQTLVDHDPDHAEYYTRNANEYIQRLQTLDRNLASRFDRSDTDAFMVFHPSWGYLARDYGLEQIAIEHDGKEPSSKRMQALINKAREHDISLIFVQEQFDTNVARSIAAEIDAEIVSIDPLAKQYIENLNNIADVLTER